jgi:hypothetical protein
MSANLDRIGSVLSATCAIHCALAPVAIGALIATPFGWMYEESTELLLLCGTLLLAGISLYFGYRKHGLKRCWAFFGFGCLMFLVAHTVTEHESFQGAASMASGGVALCVAHLLNWRHSKKCTTDCTHAH